jgi:hypothetical protein
MVHTFSTNKVSLLHYFCKFCSFNNMYLCKCVNKMVNVVGQTAVGVWVPYLEQWWLELQQW